MRILDALVVGGLLTGAASALAQATPPSESPAQIEAQDAPEHDAPAAMPPRAHDEALKPDDGMTPKTAKTAKTRTAAKMKTSRKPPSSKAKAEDPAPGDVIK
jgi:hypothetical protein